MCFHPSRLAGMVTNFKGSWATVGVLIEKGQPKVSAAGKNFSIWKLASLDGAVISIFLFGAAYTQHWKESAGAVFAVFSAKVRLDERVGFNWWSTRCCTWSSFMLLCSSICQIYELQLLKLELSAGSCDFKHNSIGIRSDTFLSLLI